MDDERYSGPWVHIGECPVCVNGLARVRTCGEGESRHLFAICDECEAVWTEPDTAASRRFADAEDPRCPLCDLPLYGEQSHWSMPSEVEGSPWSAAVIFAWPSTEAADTDEQNDGSLDNSQSQSGQPSLEEMVDPEDRSAGC